MRPALSPRPRNAASRAFTLLELAFVLGILSVLTAAAIPGFQSLLLRSRAAEAREVLEVLAHAELAHFRDKGAFVACPAEPPAVPSGVRGTFDGTREGWRSLGFKPDGALRFQYEVRLVDGGYLAIARGDLDGDGDVSVYELDGRTGVVTAASELE